MSNLFDDTIVAPATVPGTGAITVIRLSGPSSISIVDKVVTFKGLDASHTKPGRTRFGRVHDDAALLDEVLVSLFRAPHSYTGEDSAEISCHASPYIAQRLLELLCAAGARLAEPGEFTKRAFLNGKMDLAQAEAVADLIESSAEGSHRLAINQLRGGFSSELASLRSQLLDITALLELELDFSEEDVEFADRSRLSELASETLAHVQKLADSFRLGNAIKNGIPVAIVGATNSGKSTLLNALLSEERAIVSDIAGTTRDTIEETLNIGGLLFRFIDTAGLRETSEAVEKIGIERSLTALHKAQTVLLLIDSSRPLENSLTETEKIISEINFTCQHLVILLNKNDKLPITDCSKPIQQAANLGNKSVSAIDSFVSSIENLLLKYFDFTTPPSSVPVLPISAKLGTGLPELCSILVAPYKVTPRYSTNSAFLQDSDALSPSSTPTSSAALDSISTVTLVSNQRHYEALRATAASLSRVLDGLRDHIPSDLIAQDLRSAISSLGSIIGQFTPDEVLSSIFSRFCIGK